MSFYGRKVCHCGKQFDMSKATKEIAPPELQQPFNRTGRPVEVYVCDRCGGIHHTVQEVTEVKRGPKNNTGIRHAVSHRNGQSTITWGMPGGAKVDTVEFHTYPRRFVMQPEPLIFQVWRLLMDKVAIIKAEPTGPGDNALEAEVREQARKEARGVAETLAILMRPFMDPPEGSSRSAADMVVKHALARYDDPDYQVPGLGEHLWDPTKNPDGSLRVPVSDSFAKTHTAKVKPQSSIPKPPKKAARVLSAEEAEGIKSAVESGMFSKDEVAGMFKVTVAEVDRAIGA